MKLDFLGTSHGIAEKDRFRTSMLLEVGERMYFIDLGAPVGTLLKNRGINFQKVKAAFITHMHSDHAIDVVEYAGMCNWQEDEKRLLYFPEESDIDAFSAWVYAMHGEEAFSKGMCELRSVKPGKFYKDENVSVTSILTHHLKRGPSYAYIFEGEGKRILFTGDLAGDFSDYPDITQKEEFDAVVCELTHFEVETALPLLNTTKAKKIIFNHVRDDKVELLKQNEDKIKFSYHIANDGDVLEI